MSKNKKAIIQRLTAYENERAGRTRQRRLNHAVPELVRIESRSKTSKSMGLSVKIN